MPLTDPKSIDHTQKENNIAELQRNLRGLSYADSTMPRPAVTGVRDDVTDDALRAFQKNTGLEQTANADLATWQALDLAHRNAARRYSPASALYPVPGDAFFSMPRPIHFTQLLQLILNTLSSLTEVIPPTAMTGQNDEQTARALSALQSLSGLPPTGVLDAATWDALTALYNLEAKKYLASPPIKPPEAMPST